MLGQSGLAVAELLACDQNKNTRLYKTQTAETSPLSDTYTMPMRQQTRFRQDKIVQEPTRFAIRQIFSSVVFIIV